MQFFTDTIERWRAFDFSFVDIIIFIVLGLAVWWFIYLNHSVNNSIAEEKMDEKNFVMRKHKAATYLWLIFLLIIGVAFFFWTDNYLFPSIFIPFGILMFLFRISWKVHIDGSEIHYKSMQTLFRRQTISFHGIQRAEAWYQRNARGDAPNIRVYSNNKKLFSVEENTRGYALFVNRLTEANVPGAEAIREELENS